MKSFTAIDFETADKQRNSACAIGIVKVVNNVIVEKYYSLIQPPGNKYSDACLRIHMVRPAHTKNVLSFNELLPKLKPLLENQTIVSHSNFDIEVLQASLNYYGLDIGDLNVKYVDTMKIYNGRKLKELCKDYDIELRHHDPLSDAEACAYLYIQSDKIIEVQEAIKAVTNKNKEASLEISKKSTKFIPDYSIMSEIDSPFRNKRVVVTGTFINWPDEMRDIHLKKLLERLGATVTSAVSGITDYILAGNEAGPKKMEQYNTYLEQGKDIKLLNEKAFLEMIHGIRLSVSEDDEFIRCETINIDNGKFFTINASKINPKYIQSLKEKTVDN